MKKLLILTLLVILSNLAFAQQEPLSITDVGDVPFEIDYPFVDYSDPCTTDGTDIYCVNYYKAYHPVGNPSGWSRGYITKFDISEGTYTQNAYVQEFNSSYAYNMDCNYYNDELFCMVVNENTNILTPVTVGLDGSSYTAYTTQSVTDDYISCNLRPTTDEFWCWLGYWSPYPLYKYDLSLDSWSQVSNFQYPVGAEEYWAYNCEFRDDNELWCIVGGTKGIVYYIDTNTTTEITYPYHVSHSGVWYNDVFYSLSGLEGGALDVLSNIVYFNPANNTNGTLSASLTNGAGWGTSVTVGTSTYVFGGYDYSWADNLDVEQVMWELPAQEGYEPMHGITDVTGLVIDFGVEFGMQAIALAGIIALIGIAVWIRGRLR